MADACFQIENSFSERAPERLVKEVRVVAEAVRAPGCIDDPAFYSSTKGPDQHAIANQRDDADEAGGTVLYTAQSSQQKRVVLFVGDRRSGESRGVDARGSVERVHLQTGIVGEQISANRAPRSRVLSTKRSLRRFCRCSRARAGKLRGHRTQGPLNEIPAAYRGCWWRNIRSRGFVLPLDHDQILDPAAGQLQQAEQLRVVERNLFGGGLSSTNWPEPVITTFMSTSACESSW